MSQGKDAGGRGGAGTWGKLFAAMFTSTPVNKGMRGEAASTRRLPQIDNPVLVGAAGLGALAVGAAVKTLRPGRRGGRASRFRVLLARAALNGETGSGALLDPDDVCVEVHEAFGKPPLVSVDVKLRAERVRDVLAVDDEEPAAPEAASGSGESPDGPLEEAARVEGRIAEIAGLMPRATLVDLLTRVVEAAWDNPEIAPVAVRGRVLLVPDEGETRTVGASSVGSTGGFGVSAPRSAGGVLHRGRGVDGSRYVGEPAGARILVDMEDLGFVDETARPADLFDKFGAPSSDPSWRP